MNNIKSIALKEFSSFFSSLTAYIFFGTFLTVTLFVFFWVETFFSRNLAEVRPMFEWMPTLLIFLVPALTMRMWSEERRAGTLELLLTAPATNFELVAGKFAACIALVALAMILTLPLPITVSLFLGSLDWGPVIGGYLATLFLAGAYIAIGLYVSAKSDNQIVSLIIAIAICGIFLLLGAEPITRLFDTTISEFLKLLGSGSRFQSIIRGVIDFRDLYYYLSIMGVFLSLNILGLEKLRWSGNPGNSRHRQWTVIGMLVCANFLAGNLWLQQVSWARLDMTENKIYSISDSTRNYLKQLKEPLLIRGYFSKKNHPLLAPLLPQLKDIMKEYAIAGNGMVKVEYIDPLETPEIEREAGEKYNIKPVVFQTSNKYQAAVVNSYFDIVIAYGDQFQKLDFRDLIEVKVGTGKNVDIELRNPEYDITSAIKKVMYSFSGTGDPFAEINKPVRFIGYVSSNENLPAPLKRVKSELDSVLADLKKSNPEKFTIEFEDPDAAGGKLAEEINKTFGFRKMVASIDGSPSALSTFWFYLLLECGDQKVQVPLPDQISKFTLEQNLKNSLKRFSKNYLKTVAIAGRIQEASLYQDSAVNQHFATLKEYLSNEYRVIGCDLKSGFVPDDTDILIVLAPDNFDDKQVFALDQFLLKGGNIVLCTSHFAVSMDKSLGARPRKSGLSQWLESMGLEIAKSIVLDPRYSPFPIPEERMIGTYFVQETQLVPYPYFINVRESGMNQECGIFSGINELTMSWSSPLSYNETKNKDRQLTPLLRSSDKAWTRDSYDVKPDQKKHGELGFEVGEDLGAKLLALAVEGRFESFFKGKQSPLLGSEPAIFEDQLTDETRVGFLDKSSENGRLILIGSETFLSDEMLAISSIATRSAYRSPIEMMKNAIDWSLEDRELLAIRGRGHFARTLAPLERQVQLVFEYMNYFLALFGLAIVALVRKQSRSLRSRRQKALLSREAN